MTQPADRIDRLGGQLYVTVGGREYDVPDHPARAWVESVVRQEYDAVIPGLLDAEDAAELYDELTAVTWTDDDETDDDEEPPLSWEDCRKAALELETAAAGRPWWEAHRLVIIAIDSWESFDGWCVEKGITPLQLPYDRFLNVALRWILVMTPQKEHEDFLQRLRDAPRTNPADLSDNPEWDEQEAAGFLAAMGMAGGASGG